MFICRKVSFYSIRRKDINSKIILMGSWEHLLLYVKFMELLPNKMKEKNDVFFLSYTSHANSG